MGVVIVARAWPRAIRPVYPRLSFTPPTHPYTQICVGVKTTAFPTVYQSVADPIKGLLQGRRRKRAVTALNRVSAVLEPNKLYLVLGGPKSGKTSLLKTIAGAFWWTVIGRIECGWVELGQLSTLRWVSLSYTQHTCLTHLYRAHPQVAALRGADGGSHLQRLHRRAGRLRRGLARVRALSLPSVFPHSHVSIPLDRTDRIRVSHSPRLC